MDITFTLDLNLVLAIVAVLIVLIAIWIVYNNMDTPQNDQKIVPLKMKLDVPLVDDNVLYLGREGCHFCDLMNQYIEENKESIKLNLIIVMNKSDGTVDYNEKFSDLDETEKNKIDDIMKEYMSHPEFGFPCMFKKDEVMLGFQKDNLKQFFEI
jgi:thioredoxin-related protein